MPQEELRGRSTASSNDGAPVNAPSAAAGPIELGLYFDLRNPPEWRQDPARTYAFALEMCEEAEHLGAHSVWFTEHHKFDDDYLAAPLTFASAVAARTRRIRIGTAIVIAPLHHPAELAEQSAAVDLISDGRLELGIGTGYRVPEYQLYDRSMAGRYAATDDMARRLRELWGPGGVTPRPVQERLPLWLGYQNTKGARRAGLLGEGLLTARGELWESYASGLRDGGFSTDDAAMAGAIQGWVSEDPDQDWALVSKHLSHQMNSYMAMAVEGTDKPMPPPVDTESIRRNDVGDTMGSFFYGTPDRVARQIRSQVGTAPVKTVFLFASLSGMPEEMVAGNVRTLCTKLAPLLKAGGEAG